MRVQTVVRIFPRIVQLVAQLFLIWITLDWKVRKARKAFEKELIEQGISKEDAKQLSEQIKMAKDQLMGSILRLARSKQDILILEI